MSKKTVKALVALVGLCALLLFALVATIGQASRAVPTPYALLEVTGVRAERAQEGCWITVEVKNVSSRDSVVKPEDFIVFDEGEKSLELLSEVADNNSPFAMGWKRSLPAGRSTTVRFLVSQPQAEQISVCFLDTENPHITAVE